MAQDTFSPSLGDSANLSSNNAFHSDGPRFARPAGERGRSVAGLAAESAFSISRAHDSGSYRKPMPMTACDPKCRGVRPE